eukprot:m.162201 g.162201  ORF g.162201 m.162201 type:complete len:321 (-) comp17661_c0_seq13:69-1031(-)
MCGLVCRLCSDSTLQQSLHLSLRRTWRSRQTFFRILPNLRHCTAVMTRCMSCPPGMTWGTNTLHMTALFCTVSTPCRDWVGCSSGPSFSRSLSPDGLPTLLATIGTCGCAWTHNARAGQASFQTCLEPFTLENKGTIFEGNHNKHRASSAGFVVLSKAVLPGVCAVTPLLFSPIPRYRVHLNDYFHNLYYANHKLNKVRAVRLHVNGMEARSYDDTLTTEIMAAELLDHTIDPCVDGFVPHKHEQGVKLFIDTSTKDPYETWVFLAGCWKIWDLDARGMYKKVWRLWLRETRLLVIGSTSPFAKAKPSAVKPLRKKKPSS